MNILAAAKAISMAADVARTLELQRHLSNLIASVKARKGKSPKAKNDLELIDDQIQVLNEAVGLLIGQMKAMDDLNGRLVALEAWASLPWWKRAFSQPKPYVPDASAQPDSVPQLPSGLS
jgi:hypothetical protein